MSDEVSTVSTKIQNEPIQDLRQWLDAVSEIDELVKVSEPVSRDQEMSAIGYLLAKQQPSPTVMFERPSDLKMTVSERGFYGIWPVPA